MRKRTVLESCRPELAALLIATLLAGCNRSSTAKGSSATEHVDAAMRAERALGAPVGVAIAGSVPTAPPTVTNVSSAAAPAQGDAFRAGAPLPPIDPTGAMLIRHGQASVEVKRVDDAVAAVRQSAAQLGGFVANTSLKGGRDQQRTALLEVRVPTAQFDALIAALASVGKVESVNATAQDVADEYVDLAARAANARRVEARFIEMLAGRTGKLSEILAVEQELRRVREEIERYDARLKWLERRTALSSLEVSLHEPLPLIDRRPGPGPIAEAFAEAWARAVAVLAWCIASLGVLVPLGALVAAVALIARRLLRPGTPPGVSGA
jgi:hypothetical protein